MEDEHVSGECSALIPMSSDMFSRAPMVLSELKEIQKDDKRMHRQQYTKCGEERNSILPDRDKVGMTCR